MSEQTTVLNIEQLFKQDQYVIPIYQRNYAWEEAQIEQLIQDIVDAGTTDYYLGSLVVFKRNSNKGGIYETIDGQQRLTTLNILLDVLKHEYNLAFNEESLFQLKFDSREISSDTILYFNQHGTKPTSMKQNTAMVDAYRVIKRKLGQLFPESNSNDYKRLEEFYIQLKKKVHILRIEVPEKTDLNHYFEVMNNRGEQLEKHEILKAAFLNVLKDNDQDRNTFNQIWEACSQMDRYVQYTFDSDVRPSVFGDYWTDLPEDFEQVQKKLANSKIIDNKTDKKTILEIVSPDYNVNYQSPELDEDEEPSRFTTVVSFSNFLLHVLRVWLKKDVQLDDKKLIPEFEKYILKKEGETKEDKVKSIKEFAYALLKCKFLFDQYIVKRALRNGKDNWHLLKLRKQDSANIGYYIGSFDHKKEGENKGYNHKLVMLLSMFHVSFPQTIYKHWLSGALHYLHNINQGEVIAEEYIQYLEQMSDAFFYDRLNEKEFEYYDIIFKYKCIPQNQNLSDQDIQKNLNIGTNVQNFIFNRLDYQLLKDINYYKWQIEGDNIDGRMIEFNTRDFEFTFRSSVEHYAPQHPKSGEKPIDNLNEFGNLCLISRSKNSELSNYSPTSKKEHYHQQKKIDSIKQRLMMSYLYWNENTVRHHQKKMIEALKFKVGERPEQKLYD